MTTTPITIPGQSSISEFIIFNKSNNILIDATSSVNKISIVESIDKKSITSTAIISDLGDLLNEMPLQGDERVSVKWEFDTQSPLGIVTRELIFRIISIGNIGFSLERPGIGFEIDMISEFGFEQGFYITNQSFKNTISQVANILHNKVNESENLINSYDINVTDTSGIIDFIIPGEKTFDAMDYLIGWASNENYKSGLWFYFQNLDGYNFVNLEQLYENVINESDEYWLNRTYTLNTDIRPTDKNALYTINNIRQLKRNSMYNLAHSGRIVNKINEFSFTHKRVTSKHYNFYDEQYNLPGKDIISSDDFKDKYTDIATKTHWTYRDHTRPDFKTGEFMAHKWSMYKIINNNTIQMQIAGNPSLTAGDLIHLNIPKPDSIVNNQSRNLDESVSGKYIIKDIITNISVNIYTQDLTLIRPGIN